MSRSYVFEWDSERGLAAFGGRVYAGDGVAVSAAKRFFKGRTQDLNDELVIYEGWISSWGCAEGRVVGKICFDPLGHEIKFLPPPTADE